MTTQMAGVVVFLMATTFPPTFYLLGYASRIADEKRERE